MALPPKTPKAAAPVNPKTSRPKPNRQTSPGSIGNTTGLITPKPSPNGAIAGGQPTKLTNPDVSPETPEEKGIIRKAVELYDKGNIKKLEAAQQGILKKIDSLVEASDYAVPAMVAGAISTAVIEVFFPTNVLDLLPGGKAGKGAKAAKGLGKKPGKEIAEKAAKEAAGKEAKEVSERAAKEETEKETKNARKKPDGAYNNRNRANRVSNCGESLAKAEMQQDGFDEVVSVQNNSGHGVDVIGRNSRTGEVKVCEVKTTEGNRAPDLSQAQKEMGGKRFTEDRLKRASRGQGNYGKLPQVMRNAFTAIDWIMKAGNKVTYEKREVFIEDIDMGCSKRKPSIPKPWKKG